jgi:hypothetical protein
VRYYVYQGIVVDGPAEGKLADLMIQIADEVKKALPSAGQNEIWQAVKDNGVKDNTDYSAYNSRNKKQEDHYQESGKLRASTPSIYNQRAVDFIVNALKGQA